MYELKEEQANEWFRRRKHTYGVIMQHIDIELPETVGISEAAKYLGVARKIVYQLIDFGELRAVREKGKIIIDPCSLREFRQRGKMV